MWLWNILPPSGVQFGFLCDDLVMTVPQHLKFFFITCMLLAAAQPFSPGWSFSATLVMEYLTMVSSANEEGNEFYSLPSMSVMFMEKKRKSPRTGPCGTPMTMTNPVRQFYSTFLVFLLF